MSDPDTEPDSDPQRRQLITGIIVTRHLHQAIHTGAGTRLCAKPITTAIYRRFLWETQIHVSDGPEQFSPDRHKVGMDQPIVGVYGSDAITFVRWVNSVVRGESMYRLPRRGEIDDAAGFRVLTTSGTGTPPLSAWLAPDDSNGPPVLWTPQQNNHPYMISDSVLAQHIKEDVENLTTTLAQILLLQSTITLCALRPVLDRACNNLDRSLGLDRDHNLTRNRGLTHDVIRDFTHARDLTRDLDRSLTLVHDLDRSPVLDHALDLTRNLDRVLTHPQDIVLTRTGARDVTAAAVGTWSGNLDVALADACARNLNHTSDINWVLDLDGALDRIRSLRAGPDDALASIAGRALARALAVALGTTTKAGETQKSFHAKFLGAFISATGVAASSYVVSPDTLADSLREGRRGLDSKYSPWSSAVASRLEEIALPVFTRRQPLTAHNATVIRLVALCLAVEAEERNRVLGDTFREIAAGVTLLERRANGQTPATETIILAAT